MGNSRFLDWMINFGYPAAPDSYLLQLHSGIKDALAEDDAIPQGKPKKYGVRGFRDFKDQTDALEVELDKRPVKYNKIEWLSMQLICRNLRFLRDNIPEAQSGGLRNAGISDFDAEKHESDPEACTNEVLERYCYFYSNNTGVVPDVFGRLWPDRLRTEDLTQQWKDTFGKPGGHYGNPPYRKP